MPTNKKSRSSIALDDKYRLESGHAFMSGIHALVRIPMQQRRRDLQAGKNTAALVSGYRGSPLGGYDQALWQAKNHLDEHHVVFRPGVNEELAATAVWGTQQTGLPGLRGKFDGVMGLWYGKGPGVDRSGDVFKHANLAGTAPLGGVVAVAGDDHICKSSTSPHQSDQIFVACGMPVFFPSNVQEILDFGAHAIALSRFSGLWSGLKTIQEVVESTTVVDVGLDRVKILLPELGLPEGRRDVHLRWPDDWIEQEARLMNVKWPLARAYIAANGLNRTVLDSGQSARLGIAASGKAWNDLQQALQDLGLDEAECRRLGLRLHKVGVVWPLDPATTQSFGDGLQDLLVVEEKRELIETQFKEALYGLPSARRPTVVGKREELSEDGWLLRPTMDLNPGLVARALVKRLEHLGLDSDTRSRFHERLNMLDAKEKSLNEASVAAVGSRPSWFCSGCPHNTSTVVPEGSRTLGGIGCHLMSIGMDRDLVTFSQMGGEGASWVGTAPFVDEPHVFANLGDGTYFHSGLLALRQSISAGVNITYKILFNDAVAMTGGQPVDGTMTVPQITRELEAEGARRIVVVTDEPDRYVGVNDLAAGVTVFHRDDLDRVQRELRETPGCTVLIYDQTCATEKRRRRKRGQIAPAPEHVLINEAVCEGCGDCSRQSNCLSVEPLETDFGRKRQINQSSCNQDFSCLKGFCPSFVTLEGTKRKSNRKLKQEPLPAESDHVADPTSLPTGPCRVVVAGIGGTGVVTVGQLLGMAAHLEGKAVVTQDATGLAQKGGATWSHVQIAATPSQIPSTRVSTLDADLVIACDGIVGAHRQTLSYLQKGRSRVVLNSHETPTANFVRSPDWQFPAGSTRAVIDGAVGANHVTSLDAEALAVRLLGDAIFTNALLLGVAWQMGLLPLLRESLHQAIRLNAVQVEGNISAFEYGRKCAAMPAWADSQLTAANVIKIVRQPSPDELVSQRIDYLRAYQDDAYAQSYATFVQRVHETEARFGSQRLSGAVAKYLFKLMAYKDEYEVARLQTDVAFERRISEMFDGPVRIVHHFAPPVLTRHNSAGEPVKRRFGPWIRPVLRVLARLRFLRGTAFDPFGRTAERQTERALISEYRERIARLLPTLSQDNLNVAVAIASVPEEIRGFGHVKARHLKAAQDRWHTLEQQWSTGIAHKPSIAADTPSI
jgi:indolepyruvate ferredoxin oxidoreductase